MTFFFLNLSSFVSSYRSLFYPKMGRAKAIMKRIQDNRVRKTTFLHRRKGLLKKMSDFSTICDSQSNACLIVYDGDGAHDSTPEIWPQNPTVVHSVLQKYECEKNNKTTPVMKFELEEFFETKKKSVEDEIAKVKKEIINLKFPTWDPIFLSLGKERLGPLIAELDAKISACDQRVNLLKGMQESEVINANMAQEEEDISETHVISAPISPVIDGMVDSTEQVNGHLECTNQVIDEMVDSTDQVNGTLDCTNQVFEPVDSDSGLEEWACKFLESDYWANQQGEPVDSASGLEDWACKFPERANQQGYWY
ncbi:MADS-box transcription factor 30-like isoform X1 [Lotus japonicus]|uniref:MADS-box transcription factor 30-like isoform X1 n=1 Tax=Lotus japonicus TaxID=34305 RepID=UPI0025884A8F|nr:MADS-box transcription factor 30-like isoform X1 [Lotus japonicus]XP_057442728.1 MADS-box transcription factor 30-like isoform X1 [Lotus japonicus]XP_057442729.1 MADS-box transcription factor 30-like isoform X1 [Lotus japonicus]XP_057442730.1 MADS-box transcription factor 30-like isoform X1 [Lotus japonicus]